MDLVRLLKVLDAGAFGLVIYGRCGLVNIEFIANASRFIAKGSTTVSTAMKEKIRDSSIGNTKDNGHRDDAFTDIDLRYMGGLWVMIAFDSVEAKEKFLLSTRVCSWFSQLIQASSEFITDERVTLLWVEIEGFFKSKTLLGASHRDSGWTPDLDDQNIGKGENDVSRYRIQRLEEEIHKSRMLGVVSMSQKWFSGKGPILMLMDELVKVGQTIGYNMDGCMKNIEEIIESQGVDGVNFLTLQETKMESIDLFESKMWGNFAFDYVHSASVGKSGGILCVWDPNAFKKLNSTVSDYFVMIQGNWVSNGKLLLIISVYAPQELSEKKSLWDYLCHVIDNWKGSVIIMGDFNEVRNKNERFGTIFNVLMGAIWENAFNYLSNGEFRGVVLKLKKKHSFILKIDFEKAYDSVRWDYLDDVLRKFGFGEKWCGWIQECLRSSWGSVLVNGSPTEEFQFFKGLKQGSKVGGNMSRIKSWDEIVDKMVDRLSKWKMKTLSIGGRLTLLKAVLGSMPIYHMSIFKVPMKVLQRMESIRSRFFSGVDLNSKKSIWVKWSKVLCSKEKGGLGVSSLYALNRALMCKWVWRFTTQKNLLWTRVIKAIHGEDGKNGSGFKVGYKSIWRSILQEVETLKIKGLWHWRFAFETKDILGFMVLEVKKTVDVASKLSQENLTWSFRRAPRSGVEQDQLTDLTTYVEGVVLGVTPDRWYWTLDGSGEFSVASARKVIDENSVYGSSCLLKLDGIKSWCQSG
ncbi:RNA-directed DNA polymerase, eukaryota, reverse transcriptase zinc-binding domain protein [Tanacetum coccineum]